ncbi:hypothetical protein FOZ63_033030, partial [Perkinsus olseni]
YTQFMRSHCIKDDLQTKVRRYIDHKFDKDLTTSVLQSMMTTLSSSLQNEVLLQLHGKLLIRVKFLSLLPRNLLGRICILLLKVHYAPMDIVYYKGDLGNSTYWITSGKIREIGRDDLDKMASDKERDPRMVAHRMGGNATRTNPVIGDSVRYTLGDDGAADDDDDPTVPPLNGITGIPGATLLYGKPHDRSEVLYSEKDVMSDTCLFVDEPRRATAICQTFVEVVTVTRKALQEQLHGNSDWLKLYFKEAALIACANNNDAELKRLLSRKFIDITTRAPKTREHLIHIAAYYKSSGVVKALLEREADVNAELEDGKTALHIAVYNEDKKLVSMLAKHGANAQYADKKGLTPKDIARLRNLKKVEMLLDTMDIHSKARVGDVEGVRDALLEGCEAGWIHPKTGTTPLYNAVHKGHYDVAALILSTKVDPDLAPKHGLTPL